MKKKVRKRNTVKAILLTVAAFLFIAIIIIPLSFSIIKNIEVGNVALIPVEGIITGNGGSYLGQSTVSSKQIVQFIRQAEENQQVKVILFEINSPGGGAVASDEISTAIKKSKKPTIALIREVGASGGYWIASAADHSIANRMSITGSIGVISSYLEFSGLMDKYGVGYERLVAGSRKDIGTPFKKLSNEEKAIFQKKLDRIHDFFIEEIAANRNMDEDQVRKVATGEFYLGVEALQLGLIDQLGDKETAEQYIREKHGIEKVDYITYRKELSFFELLGGVLSDFSFALGEGLGAILLQGENRLMLI